MSTEELKTEIQKLLNQIPEHNLEHVYQLLKEVERSPSETIQLTENLTKILAEDTELLKKLAQ